MNARVKRSFLAGTVRIPGSKSHTIRGLICGTLAGGTSVLRRPLFSDDTMACLKACEKFGAKVVRRGDALAITGTAGRLNVPDDIVDTMNSGTTLYFAMGLASLVKGWTVLTGDSQIRSRPAGELLRALSGLGAEAFSSRGNDRAPLAIRGLSQGGQVTLRAKSSQYLSSLLICSPLYKKKTTIRLLLLNERPYVDMTLSWLKDCGIKVAERPGCVFEVPPGQKYRPFRKTVPSDFSSAAFFITAAALFSKGKVAIEGLDMADVQGDKAVVRHITDMGASITHDGSRVIVEKRPLRGIRIDIKDTPDLLPILSVAGCYAEGETVIFNGEHVREKETDRIAVMTRELRKMGARVTETRDGMVISGGSGLRAAAMEGHDDHRVIMSLAVAAMGCSGTSTIRRADAVSVTFPGFFDLMRSLGARVHTDSPRQE
jgi:3-phosphoshikimate 1-carboxyvinyltransferase